MREKLKTRPSGAASGNGEGTGVKGISTLKKAEIIDRLCELEKPVEEGQKEETPQASVSEHPAGSAEPAERTEMHVQPRRTDAGQNTSAQTYSQPRRSANGERAAGGQNSSYERRSEGGYRRNEYGSYTRRENNNTLIRIIADASTRSERGIREIPMCRVTITMKHERKKRV